MRLVILLVFLLAGCSSVVPVHAPFPKMPQELEQPCKPLKQADSAQLSEFTKTVVENYAQYHDCAAQENSWRIWYHKQKQLFEELDK